MGSYGELWGPKRQFLPPTEFMRPSSAQEASVANRTPSGHTLGAARGLAERSKAQRVKSRRRGQWKRMNGAADTLHHNLLVLSSLGNYSGSPAEVGAPSDWASAQIQDDFVLIGNCRAFCNPTSK
jgi:hypothetical protein